MSYFAPAGDESDCEFDDFDDDHEIPSTSNISNSNITLDPETDNSRKENVATNCIIVKVKNENLNILLSEFQNAVISGNINIVKRSIEDCPSLCNTLLNSGWPAITYACKFGNIAIVKILTEAGCDVNLTGPDGCTAMMAACKCTDKWKNTKEIVEFLLKQGANTSVGDKNGKTALMLVAKYGNNETLKLLLQQNDVEVDLKDNNGWTALDWALAGDSQTSALLLIKAGARVISRSCHLNRLSSEMKDMMNIFGKTSLSEVKKENYDTSVSGDGQHVETITESCKIDYINPLNDAKPSMEEATINEITINHDSTDNAYQRYGQLELFLTGLELFHLIPKFHEHDVQFEQLLCATDSDLIAIGIQQFGARNRILTALKDWHTTEWKESSLPNFNSATLTFNNLQALLKTSSQHLLYISGAFRYATKQLEMHPHVLVPSASLQFEVNPDTLVISEVEKLVHSTHKLCSSLKLLHQQAIVLKSVKTGQFAQADYTRTERTGSVICKLVLLSLPLLISCGFVFCKPKVFT